MQQFAVVLMCVSQIGSLPEIDLEQLADLVEMQQLQYKRVHTKYDLIYGAGDKENVYDGEFVHTEKDFSISADLTIDYHSEAQFLEELRLTGDQRHTFKSRYDGNISRQLDILESTKPGASRELLGLVRQTKLSYLRVETPHHPRPGDVTFWGLPDLDLASALRAAEKAQLSTELVGGKAVYRATFDLVVKHVVERGGEQEVSTRRKRYRYSLSPEYNMLPLRIEMLTSDGAVILRYDQDDFQEVVPGLWYPFSSTRYHVFVDRGPIVIKMKIHDVDLGDHVDIPAELPFPSGTKVQDMVSGIRYTVGSTPEEWDRAVHETLEGLTQGPQNQAPLSVGTTTTTVSSGDTTRERRDLPLAVIALVALSCAPLLLLIRSVRRRRGKQSGTDVPN